MNPGSLTHFNTFCIPIVHFYFYTPSYTVIVFIYERTYYKRYNLDIYFCKDISLLFILKLILNCVIRRQYSSRRLIGPDQLGTEFLYIMNSLCMKSYGY